MCWQAPRIVQVMVRTLKADLQNLREIGARNWKGISSKRVIVKSWRLNGHERSYEVEYLACVFMSTSGSPRDETTPLAGEIDCVGPNWPSLNFGFI